MTNETTGDLVHTYLKDMFRSTGKKVWTFRARNVTSDRNVMLCVAHWLKAQTGTIIFDEYKIVEVSWSRKRGRLFRVTVIDDDYLY